MHWWTRSQRIRTIGELALEVDLLEAERVPLYQEIAPKAVHLRALGLNLSRIGRHLGVDDKTVAKALSWRLRTRVQGECCLGSFRSSWRGNP